MKFLAKNAVSALVSVLLTYFYYKDFYISDKSLLWSLLFLCMVISLFCASPALKTSRSLVFTVFLPFVIIYIFTYNALVSFFALFLSVLFALVVPKKRTYTKIIFTDTNIPVRIKTTVRRGTIRVFRNVFGVLSYVVLVLGFIFPKPSYLWLNRAFPIDITKKEVISELVVPLGTVSATAWYDENALLVESFYDIDSTVPSPAKEAGIRLGDAITHINGQRALLSDFIVKGADEKDVVLTVRRLAEDGKTEEHTFTITPAYSENDKLFRIGITYYQTAVMTSSVQTMTFADPVTNAFAATAHSSEEIYNNIDSLKGIVFSARATGRDEDGLTAVTELPIGETLRTDNYGAYGTLTRVTGEAIPLSQKSEFTLGPAILLSAFEGNGVKEYDIFITGTYRIDSRDVLCFIVTDSRILEKGGITRGMSGSPVIQRGKLVGALSNMDGGGKSGYATFARDMAFSIYNNQ